MSADSRQPKEITVRERESSTNAIQHELLSYLGRAGEAEAVVIHSFTPSSAQMNSGHLQPNPPSPPSLCAGGMGGGGSRVTVI